LRPAFFFLANAAPHMGKDLYLRGYFSRGGGHVAVPLTRTMNF